MKVARLYGPGDIRLIDEPAPEPGPGEELVRVTAVGICGSDLHWYDESEIGGVALDRPLVLGHEAAGVIVSGPRAGTRVALDPNLPCGACETCARGLGHLCQRVRFLGHSDTDGALREQMTWPSDRLVPIPDTIDDIAGATLEPLGVAIHALRLANLRPGGTIAITGAGPIGQLLIRLAFATGASTVLATDVLPHRVEAAREAGAIAEVVDGGRERERLLDALRAAGRPFVDTAVEIAGEDDAIATAAILTRPGGTVVVAGIPAGNDSVVPASVLRRKGLDLRFSRRMNRVYPDALALVASGRIRPGEVVTATYGLTEVNAAFVAAVRREGGKVVVRPGA
jgi:L-iditol 2-dehydrogenase